MVAATLVVLVAPNALAADASGGVQQHRLSLPAARGAGWVTLPTTSGRRFSMVGLRWDGGSSARFAVRARLANRAFGPWTELDVAGMRSSPTASPAATWMADPVWVGPSDAVQVRFAGQVRRLVVVLVNPGPDPALRPSHRRAATPDPTIITRADWGADETIRKGTPVLAPRLTAAFVHATLTPNGYAPGKATEIVRGIYLYQVKGNGWADIGYNFLVDSSGRVYEGRYGGVGQNVVGQQTTGFDAGTVGIALIGDYRTTAPPAAMITSLEALLAWRLDVAHVDPSGHATLVSTGNERFKKGVKVTFNVISAHADAGRTDCPGAKVVARLPAIRLAAAMGGLHVWNPTLTPATIRASGAAIVPIRFRATLSASAAWTVTIKTTADVPIATLTGTGTALDATWDGTTLVTPLPRADTLVWEISAVAGGVQARVANGAFDGSGAPLGVGGGTTGSPALTNLAATPKAIAASATGTVSGAVGWTQGQAGTARVTVIGAAGAVVAVVHEASELPAGAQRFTWDGTGIAGPVASGHYRYRIEIQPDGAVAATAATVAVDLRRQVGPLTVTTVIAPGKAGHDVATIAFARFERGPVTIRLLKGATVVANVALLYDQMPAPFTYAWGGGGVADGAYQLEVLAPGAGGVLDLKAPITVDTTGPVLGAKTVTRTARGTMVAILRVSEPGTLSVTVGSKVVRTITVAKAGLVTVRVAIAALGARRTATITGTDALGNLTRKPLRVTAPR